MKTVTTLLAPLAAAALLAACATAPAGPDARTATIQRTANGVPHISAPDPETLAYGMAYAYAQDNVCMTADQLVTVRGERVALLRRRDAGPAGAAHVPERADRPVHRRPHGRRGAGARLDWVPAPSRRRWRAARWPATTATWPTRPASCRPPATASPGSSR